MVNDSVKYPVYRKYEGNRSYFKITSLTNFTEIQVMGNRFFRHTLTAKILPDFQLIVDMINLHNNHWIVSNATEFELAESQFQESLATVK